MSADREEKVSAGSHYGSIEPGKGRSNGEEDPRRPPKPAARQRTTAAAAAAAKQEISNQQQNQQDLCASQATTRKSSNTSSSGGESATRDELNRELQAELGRKLSLARSRLEKAEELEKQAKAAAAAAAATTTNHDSSQRQSDVWKSNKTTDLSLSIKKPTSHSDGGRAAANGSQDDEELKDLPPTRAYPKKVFFIIANEFCERFSYYGLRTVLVLYLTRVLDFSDSNSTITFHLFAMLCYVTPILGAILGDSILGKFKTIFYLSVVYLLGELILMMSSIFWNYGQLSSYATFAGLLLIGFGTGGIKPCVGALGGDQFLPHELKWRQSFFSIFYAAINLGSLLTNFITPLLRTEFQCVGRQDCFPYAFGLPCALMFLSIVVFMLAKNQYYLAPLPEENVIVSFTRCVWLALKRKVTGKRPRSVLDDNLAIVKDLGQDSASSSSSTNISESNTSANEETLVASTQSSKANLAADTGQATNRAVCPRKLARDHEEKEDSRRRSHWLYLAADRFDSKSIEAFRSVLGLLLLFIPTLVYWCLFDQQGSLWTLQATRMDGRIFGNSFVLQPDQMSVANPLILLAVIPVFEMFIYPGLARCGLMKRPLQRMTMGGFLAAIAFLSAAAVELRIQQFLPPNEPKLGSANLILVNGLRECSVTSPTISHIQMPDVSGLLSDQTPALITVSATNESLASPFETQPTTSLEAATAPDGAQKQDRISRQTIKLSSLEALAVQSVELQSANSSTLNNYLLRLKLADSEEQIKSNKSFGCPLESTLEHEFTFAPLPDQATRLLYLELGNGKLSYKMFNESLELPPSNKARVRLLYEFFGSTSQAEKRQFTLNAGERQPAAANNNSKSRGSVGQVQKFAYSLRDGQVLLSEYVDIEVPSSGDFFWLETMGESGNKLAWIGANGGGGGNIIGGSNNNNRIWLEPGTRSLLIVHQSDANHVWLKHQLLQDNKYRINMLYQLIPYTLMSMSEVMFSITGLEFSYSMAPASMKSVLMAIWSLTVALGNLLTVFVESLHMFSNVAHDFTFYAALMAVDMCIFAIMGYNFRPNKYHSQ